MGKLPPLLLTMGYNLIIVLELLYSFRMEMSSIITINRLLHLIYSPRLQTSPLSMRIQMQCCSNLWTGPQLLNLDLGAEALFMYWA